MKGNWEFKGVFAIMTTPFTQTGELDLKGIAEKTSYLIDIGMSGLIPTGSVGECAAMTHDEMFEVWRVVQESAGGRLPVIAGAIDTSTNLAIMLSKRAEDLGLDGVMNMPPFYWALSEEAILRHYQALNDAISIPIMLYNNVNVTRIDMSHSLIGKLAELKNVQGIKEGTLRAEKLEKVVRSVGDRISVMSGWSVLYEPYATLIGCPAMVDPFANFLGPTTLVIRKYAEEGQYAKAFDLKKKAVSPITDFIFSFSIPQIIAAYKYMEYKIGISTSPVTRVGFELTNQQKQILNQLLEETKPHRI